LYQVLNYQAWNKIVHTKSYTWVSIVQNNICQLVFKKTKTSTRTSTLPLVAPLLFTRFSRSFATLLGPTLSSISIEDPLFFMINHNYTTIHMISSKNGFFYPELDMQSVYTH
jgi:hypothetical protein